MKTTLLALLLIAAPASAQSVPKKYDPATLQSMQAAIAKLAADTSSLRVEIAQYHQAINQINQRVNTLSMDIKSIRSQMAGLDVVQNTDRLTKLEDHVRQEDADQAKRDAASKADIDTVMAFLKWIFGAVGVLLINVVTAHIRKSRREKRTEENVAAVKSDTTVIVKQTNGVLAKMQAENETLHAELNALRAAGGK